MSLQDCQTAALYGGTGSELEDCGNAPAFSGIQQWFNTARDRPLTLAALKGKVVLVDFWAYSCINCQRELPHAEAWAKTYAAAGLGGGPAYPGVRLRARAVERQGRHRPARADVPGRAGQRLRHLDAYDNQSWPAAYLIDASGKIRHISIGEGDYGQEEQDIRQLLAAARPGITLPRATSVADTTPADAGQTPETYLGAERAQYYDGTGPYKAGGHQFTAPRRAGRQRVQPVRELDRAQAQSVTAGSGAVHHRVLPRVAGRTSTSAGPAR